MQTLLITLAVLFVFQAVGFAQGAAADAVPVSNTGIDSLISQAVVSAAAAYALEFLKKAGWFKWITPETSARAMKAVAALVALGTSLGIHYSFDPAAGIFTISGLLMPSIKDHAYDWLRSWILQQIVYDKVVNPKTTAVVATPSVVITPAAGGTV